MGSKRLLNHVSGLHFQRLHLTIALNEHQNSVCYRGFNEEHALDLRLFGITQRPGTPLFAIDRQVPVVGRILQPNRQVQ